MVKRARQFLKYFTWGIRFEWWILIVDTLKCRRFEVAETWEAWKWHEGNSSRFVNGTVCFPHQTCYWLMTIWLQNHRYDAVMLWAFLLIQKLSISMIYGFFISLFACLVNHSQPLKQRKTFEIDSKQPRLRLKLNLFPRSQTNLR